MLICISIDLNRRSLRDHNCY